MNKILVVDDEEMMRFVLSEKLGENGFETTEAEDGKQAVEIFSEGAFDAVLLDLKMPEMDGIETLKELSRINANVPVIMVTAFGDIPTAVEAIKLGAYDFVEKPPQISRIVMTLRRAIEKAILEKQIKNLGKTIEKSVALKKAYDKLKEMDRIKTAFLTSVSHELLTPLTSITGYAGIIRKKMVKSVIPLIVDESPKTQKEVRQVMDNLDIMGKETALLEKLITDVIELTKLEAGEAHWEKEEFSLADALTAALSETREMFTKKGLKIETVVEDSMPLITADRNRIESLFIRLLTNAATFTDSGQIVCRLWKDKNELMGSVSDTGRGIAPAKRKIIFDKFRQACETLTDKPKGIGLGLPLCRLIVEHYGGRIWVESSPGKGSVFSFSLPVKRSVKQ